MNQGGGALYLKQIEVGPLQNFVYLIGSTETCEVAVVDPAWDIPKILEIARRDQMKITTVLVTHTHFDHINGIPDLLRETDARVMVHKKESGAVPAEKSSVQEVEGEQEIKIGEFSLRFLHTPGHTPGSVCIVVGDKLISGDTLFIQGCGRCDLPGGDAELMYKSLTRLNHMDDHLVVHPGHNYAPKATASLKEEKAHNPFLTAPNLDYFLNMVGAIRRS